MALSMTMRKYMERLKTLFEWELFVVPGPLSLSVVIWSSLAPTNTSNRENLTVLHYFDSRFKLVLVFTSTRRVNKCYTHLSSTEVIRASLQNFNLDDFSGNREQIFWRFARGQLNICAANNANHTLGWKLKKRLSVNAGGKIISVAHRLENYRRLIPLSLLVCP